MPDCPRQEEMSAFLRNSRVTTWQTERQPRGSFGHARCAFSLLAMLMDIRALIDSILHFHFMPRRARFAPKVIDFGYINWYMWSIWKRSHDISRKMKRRQREISTLENQMPAARHCRPQEPSSNLMRNKPVNDGAGSEEHSWTFYRLKCDVRYIGRRQIDNFL